MAAFVLASTACIPEIEQVQGQRVLYEYSAGFQPCAGNVSFLDALVTFYEQQLGVNAPERFRYSWLDPDDLIGASIRRSETFSTGWAVSPSYAWSLSPVLPHEIVHLAFGVRGSAPFFEEGIAVAMDWYTLKPGMRYLEGPIRAELNPLLTMPAQGIDEVNYTAAGLFTTYLLTRYGPARFWEFSRALSWPFSLDSIKSGFRSVYGAELQEVVAEFMQDTPPCWEERFELPPYECSAPLHPWTSLNAWTLEADTSCDSSEVIGGIGRGPGPSAYIVTVDVPETRRYVFGMFSEGEERVRFGPCFGCPWDVKDTLARNKEVLHLDLERGRYYVRVEGMSDESHDFEVTLAPL